MRMILIAALVAGLAASGTSADSTHDEYATPNEVVSKVRKAAKLLADQGAAGIEVLRDSTSEFTWKDTYVFVVDCNRDLVLANPAFPKRQGGDIKQHTDYDGKQYGLELCKTAQQPGGGWVEYVWPRPGGGEPSRKISYVTKVEGRSYQLGAGIYNETISLAELRRMIQAGR